MFHIFHFLQSDKGFEIVNSFSWKASFISSEKRCLDFNAFTVNLHWHQDSKVFPTCCILYMGHFSRYTLRTRSQIKAMLVSNPIESVHASWHGMCGATNTRNVF